MAIERFFDAISEELEFNAAIAAESSSQLILDGKIELAVGRMDEALELVRKSRQIRELGAEAIVKLNSLGTDQPPVDFLARFAPPPSLTEPIETPQVEVAEVGLPKVSEPPKAEPIKPKPVEVAVAKEPEGRYLIRRLDQYTAEGKGWSLVRDESGQRVQAWVEAEAWRVGKKSKQKGEAILQMVEHLRFEPLGATSKVLPHAKVKIDGRICTVRSLSPRKVPGVNLSKNEADHLRIVYTLANLKGQDVVVIEGIYGTHKAYASAIKRM